MNNWKRPFHRIHRKMESPFYWGKLCALPARKIPGLLVLLAFSTTLWATPKETTTFQLDSNTSCENLVLPGKAETLLRLTRQWLQGDGRDTKLREIFKHKLLSSSPGSNPFDQLPGVQSSQMEETVRRFELTNLSEIDWRMFLSKIQTALSEVHQHEKQIEKLDERTSQMASFKKTSVLDSAFGFKKKPVWITTPEGRSLVSVIKYEKRGSYRHIQYIYEYFSETGEFQLINEIDLKEALRKAGIHQNGNGLPFAVEPMALDENRFIALTKTSDSIYYLVIVDIEKGTLQSIFKGNNLKDFEFLQTGGETFLATSSTTNSQGLEKKGLEFLRINDSTGESKRIYSQEFESKGPLIISLFLSGSGDPELLVNSSGTKTEHVIHRYDLSTNDVVTLENPFSDPKTNFRFHLVKHTMHSGRVFASFKYGRSLKIYEFDPQTKTYQLFLEDTNKSYSKHSNLKFFETPDGHLYAVTHNREISQPLKLILLEIDYENKKIVYLDSVNEPSDTPMPIHTQVNIDGRIFIATESKPLETKKLHLFEFVQSSEKLVHLNDFNISQNLNILGFKQSLRSDPNDKMSIVGFNQNNQIEVWCLEE